MGSEVTLFLRDAAAVGIILTSLFYAVLAISSALRCKRATERWLYWLVALSGVYTGGVLAASLLRLYNGTDSIAAAWGRPALMLHAVVIGLLLIRVRGKGPGGC